MWRRFIGRLGCGRTGPVQDQSACGLQDGCGQKNAQGPFPYPDFNPTRPDWSKYPGVAAALVKTPVIFRAWQRNMQALGEPSTGRAAWDDLLAAIRSHVRIATEQQAAAVRRDSDTFTKDYYEGRKTQDKVLQAANAAGVPGCAEVDR